VTADDAARASEGGGGDDAGRVAALTAALGGLREKVKRRDAATAEVITGTVERLRLAEADGARLQLELRSTQLALEAAKQATPVESTQVKDASTRLHLPFRVHADRTHQGKLSARSPLGRFGCSSLTATSRGCLFRLIARAMSATVIWFW